MIGLLVAAAVALAQAPVRQADLTLGMRAGAAGYWAARPKERLEVGGHLHLARDVYAGAPGWVRAGLDPKLNLHATGLAVVGVNTGDKPVSGALLLGGGGMLTAFREERTVPALPEPVVYGAAAVRPVGAVMADLRVQPQGRSAGGHLMFSLPLPFAATGSPYIERLYIGLGLQF